MRRRAVSIIGFIFLTVLLVFVAPICSVSAYADDECSHVYSMNIAPATCTEHGVLEYVCLKCEDSYTDEAYSESHPALGHNWTASYSPATCTEPEGTLYTCIRCNENYLYYDEENPYYASHPYESVDWLEPTCTEDGYTYYVCAACGEEYTSYLSAYGHEYIIADDIKDSDGHVWRTYSCIYCGDSYTEDMGRIPTSTADSIVMWFQSYQYWLWILLGIFVMVWSIYIGVKYAMARNAEETAHAKKLVSDYFLGLLSIAVICLALPYLVYIVCWLFV